MCFILSEKTLSVCFLCVQNGKAKMEAKFDHLTSNWRTVVIDYAFHVSFYEYPCEKYCETVSLFIWVPALTRTALSSTLHCLKQRGYILISNAEDINTDHDSTEFDTVLSEAAWILF